MKRKIIKIDEGKCNGCGECIPNCPEGALQVIGGKARLVSDLFCDGLGACLGHCPEGAIEVEEREAGEYDERRVMKNVVRQGENVIKAHLDHLREHGQSEYLKEAVGFLKERGIKPPPGFEESPFPERAAFSGYPAPPFPKRGGRQWPVQLNLVPPEASFLEGADLLVAADCVPFAYAGFHQDLLKGRIVVAGCPKFDDRQAYREKLTAFFREHEFKSVTVARMEVPCCRGLQVLVEEASRASGKKIPLSEVIIGIGGEKQAD